MSRTASLLPPPATVSHNQIGQRLGRKGQETRERILSAMLCLLSDRDGPPVTLTSVAREAKVRLTNLYLYFPDLGQLLLAALERVMATAEAAYLDRLRHRWDDDTLVQSCRDFLEAHYAFWDRHARILHLRNALADNGDLKVLEYRHAVSMPIMTLLTAQMDGGGVESDHARYATVLMTGLERVATVLTNPQIRLLSPEVDDAAHRVHALGLIAAEAEMMALTIAQRRAVAAAAEARQRKAVSR